MNFDCFMLGEISLVEVLICANFASMESA